ncbi:MAG: FHA domain-containing protein [Lachnospiraceae bacterium]|nr:FHA domain-containing protein [Lachnospiraceae bacterium]
MDINDLSTMSVTRSIALSGKKSGGLICIRGTHIGTMITLDNDKKVILGRDASVCTHVINDKQVSRKHIEITYVGTLNKYRIVDFSSNGTYTGDGIRLEKGKEYYLDPAEELYLGNEDNLYKLR